MWFEKLKMWKDAYQTEIWLGHHKIIGRGRTAAASKAAAEVGDPDIGEIKNVVVA